MRKYPDLDSPAAFPFFIESRELLRSRLALLLDICLFDARHGRERNAPFTSAYACRQTIVYHPHLVVAAPSNHLSTKFMLQWTQKSYSRRGSTLFVDRESLVG